MTTLWPPERVQKLVDLREGGMLFRDICIELDCTINSALNRWRLTQNPTKEKAEYIGITYGEAKLANNAQAKWNDFVLAVRGCNKAGLGVITETSVAQSYLLVFKDKNGTIGVFDEDRMRIVLSETIP